MNFKSAVVLVLFCLISFMIIAQELPPFSSIDVFELEWIEDPQISPDGSQIVYIRRSMDIMEDRRQSRLWMLNSDGSEHQKLSNSEVNESAARWSNDGSRIAFIRSTENGSEIFGYWKNTGKIGKLSQLERSPSSLSWSPDDTFIAFTMHVPEKEPKLVNPLKKPKGAKWADHPRVITRVKHEADGSGYMEPGNKHVFILPSDGGTPIQLTNGNFPHSGTPRWTDDGKKLVISGNRSENWEYDFRNSEIYSIDIKSHAITALTNRNGPDNSMAVSTDGRRLVYTGFDDKVQTYQLTRLYFMNSDGSGKREISTGLDRSISNPVWSNDGTGIFYQYDDKGNTKIGYSPLNGGSRVIAHNLGGTAVGRPYGGGSFTISNGGTIAFTYTDPYHPAELAIQKPGSDSPELPILLNEDILSRRKLGEIEEIWYKSTFDGRDIQGWLVKPPYFDPDKSYPLLVENHGGPISNYGDRFSPEIQLYAADGYVVFYPNPRGSTSYGQEFGNLLYHNYPGEDYIDVMDGVDELVKRDYLSEDSLFVTGGSAGGIMTAWMIGNNNRFEAAAVVKPVMNWISKTLTADNYFGYAYNRYPGQPWKNMDTYMKFSPLSLVGNIETPTLVMVGTADLRTPLSEAKQLYHALKLRKIETALVQIPGAYHFISNRPSQLITKVDHVLAWFRKYRK